MKNIYFDNAATSFFKPKCVKKALNKAIKQSANPGRSGHKLSIKNAKLVWSARENIARHFGGIEPENVVFAKNCTEALNIALIGVLKRIGGHVVCGEYEHNSVLRPLFELERQGIITLSVAKGNGKITKADIEKCLTSKTTLVCVNFYSNVTGMANDIKGIGALCKERGLLFLVDFAQGAGHAKIDMRELNINYLAFSGHKGFLTPQGVGALCINSKILPMPTIYGGTGSESSNTFQPTNMPESLESGTLATPLIATLDEGIKYTEKHFEKNNKKVISLVKFALQELKKMQFVTLYSCDNNVGIVSFNVLGHDSNFVSDYLDKFHIATRGGLHCAPLAHKHFGTLYCGMVRVSFSHKNTKKQVKKLIWALRKIKKS